MMYRESIEGVWVRKGYLGEKHSRSEHVSWDESMNWKKLR